MNRRMDVTWHGVTAEVEHRWLRWGGVSPISKRVSSEEGLKGRQAIVNDFRTCAK